MIRLYLDGAATTFPLETLKNKMTNWYWLNPSSPYEQALSVRESVEEARAFLLSLLERGLQKSGKTAVFTSGGTESNNMALSSALEQVRKRLKRQKQVRLPRVLISSVEHPSMYEYAKYLEGRGEISLSLIPANPDASLDLQAVDFSACDVVCAMAVNNEIGTITDIVGLRQMMDAQVKQARDERVKHVGDSGENKSQDGAQIERPFLVVDGVQTLGKIPFEQIRAIVQASDYFTVSAHKIHGFKGTGAIVARMEDLSPLHVGGGQEFGLRGGTENTVGILAFRDALSALSKNCDDAYFAEAQAAKKELLRLIDKIGDARVNTPENSTPFITSVSFAGVKSEVLLHYLAGNGYIVSNGSACSTKKLEVSRILKNCRIPEQFIDGTIRIGLSPAFFYDASKCNCTLALEGESLPNRGKKTKTIAISKKLAGFAEVLDTAVSEIRMVTGYRKTKRERG